MIRKQQKGYLKCDRTTYGEMLINEIISSSIRRGLMWRRQVEILVTSKALMVHQLGMSAYWQQLVHDLSGPLASCEMHDEQVMQKPGSCVVTTTKNAAVSQYPKDDFTVPKL